MSSKKSDARTQAVALVERILAGEITVQEARDVWPSYIGDDELDNLYAILDHWNDDDDIRAKDPIYAKLQEKEFRQMVEDLRGKI